MAMVAAVAAAVPTTQAAVATVQDLAQAAMDPVRAETTDLVAADGAAKDTSPQPPWTVIWEAAAATATAPPMAVDTHKSKQSQSPRL